MKMKIASALHKHLPEVNKSAAPVAAPASEWTVMPNTFNSVCRGVAAEQEVSAMWGTVD